MVFEAKEEDDIVETTDNGYNKDQISLLSSSNEVKEEIIKKPEYKQTKDIEEKEEKYEIKEIKEKEDIIRGSQKIYIEKGTKAKQVKLSNQEAGVFAETALEIRCSSSKLNTFPFKSGNLPKDLKFNDSAVIGNTILEIADTKIPCYINSFSNNEITYIEIKNREFKLGFSVILKDDTVKATNEYFFYEMSKGLNHFRSIEVLKILDKIFSGTPITFNVKMLFGEIEVENWIELVKIRTALETFLTARNNGFKIQMNKLANIENVFYKLNLLARLNKLKRIDTWCNLKIDNSKLSKEKRINVLDTIEIKRLLPFNEKITIEETISIIEPIGSWEIRDEKIVCKKKKCVVTLRKLRGGSC